MKTLKQTNRSAYNLGGTPSILGADAFDDTNFYVISSGSPYTIKKFDFATATEQWSYSLPASTMCSKLIKNGDYVYFTEKLVNAKNIVRLADSDGTLDYRTEFSNYDTNQVYASGCLFTTDGTDIFVIEQRAKKTSSPTTDQLYKLNAADGTTVTSTDFDTLAGHIELSGSSTTGYLSWIPSVLCNGATPTAATGMDNLLILDGTLFIIDHTANNSWLRTIDPSTLTEGTSFHFLGTTDADPNKPKINGMFYDSNNIYFYGGSHGDVSNSMWTISEYNRTSKQITSSYIESSNIGYTSWSRRGWLDTTLNNPLKMVYAPNTTGGILRINLVGLNSRDDSGGAGFYPVYHAMEYSDGVAGTGGISLLRVVGSTLYILATGTSQSYTMTLVDDIDITPSLIEQTSGSHTLDKNTNTNTSQRQDFQFSAEATYTYKFTVNPLEIAGAAWGNEDGYGPILSIVDENENEVAIRPTGGNTLIWKAPVTKTYWVRVRTIR